MTTSSSSWVRTITSPFRKACTFFNNQEPSTSSSRDHKMIIRSQQGLGGGGGGGRGGHQVMDHLLHGEVMACGYEDVQVMWSILDDKSKPPTTTTTACTAASS